jgi:hypothetical protein
MGLWEILNNENFNRVEFDAFKNEAGRYSFIVTPLNPPNLTGLKANRAKSFCHIAT